MRVCDVLVCLVTKFNELGLKIVDRFLTENFLGKVGSCYFSEKGRKTDNDAKIRHFILAAVLK